MAVRSVPRSTNKFNTLKKFSKHVVIGVRELAVEAGNRWIKLMDLKYANGKISFISTRIN